MQFGPFLENKISEDGKLELGVFGLDICMLKLIHCLW